MVKKYTLNKETLDALQKALEEMEQKMDKISIDLDKLIQSKADKLRSQIFHV